MGACHFCYSLFISEAFQHFTFLRARTVSSCQHHSHFSCCYLYWASSWFFCGWPIHTKFFFKFLEAFCIWICLNRERNILAHTTNEIINRSPKTLKKLLSSIWATWVPYICQTVQEVPECWVINRPAAGTSALPLLLATGLPSSLSLVIQHYTLMLD